jgi:GNAT superfamily N-acetyltransferase
MRDRSEPAFVWREANASDLAEIGRLARQLHPGYPERPETFAEKRRLSPSTHFVVSRGGTELAGYACAFPWSARDIPPLDTLLEELPAAPEVLYIHDVALLAEARGKRLTEVLLAKLVAAAASHGLQALALTAVGGAERVWRRHGFLPESADMKMRTQLRAYAPAIYMMRSIAAEQHPPAAT